MPSHAIQTEPSSISKVFIFYSSTTEPKILDQYADALTYLKEAGINAEIVDVSENKDLAREHNVHATPMVIVKSDGEEKRHLGIVSGLKTVLEDDAYGRTILHEMGFKEGREAAANHDMADAGVDGITATLEQILEGHGLVDIAVEAFDPDACTATVRMRPDLKHDDKDRGTWHDKMGEFLGGFFTEIFQEGVMATEITCASDADEDECQFALGSNGDNQR